MAISDLIPWSRGRSALASREGRDPFLTLHREMNRLFDEVWRGFDAPAGLAGGWPSLDIAESDSAVTVTADVPGMEEKDIELSLRDNVLVIKGEKKSESKDEERHFSERYYGRFERRVRIDTEIDEDKVTASFKNGVLTVTLPKAADTERKARRIAINQT